MDPWAAEPGSLAGQPTHLRQQPLFVGTTTRLVTLRVASLAQHPTGTPLRNLVWPQTTTYFDHDAATSFGAYQFPLAASRKISMSKAWFATSFFKRAFSC